jgi:hypothetical protein
MTFFNLFDSIANAISGLIWRWGYQHRAPYSTQLAVVRVWHGRR